MNTGFHFCDLDEPDSTFERHPPREDDVYVMPTVVPRPYRTNMGKVSDAVGVGIRAVIGQPRRSSILSEYKWKERPNGSVLML